MQPIAQKPRCDCEDESDGAQFFSDVERAGLFVTAIQFDRNEVTTLAWPCQSTKPFSRGPLEASRTAPEVAAETISARFLAKMRKSYIYQLYSISRCALLNAPAGSFSNDIDEVEVTT